MGVGEESDEDPFGSGASARSGTDEEEEDVEEMGVDVHGGDGEQGEDEDEDIDSDEAFGEGDGEKFRGFRFRGSKRLGDDRHTNGLEDGVDVEGHQDVGGSDSGLEELLFGKSESGSGEDGSHSNLGGAEDSDEEGGSSQADTEEQEQEDDDEDGDEDADASNTKATDERAELRKMMAEEQKTVVATISQAAKADVEKGIAVKHQRSTFDALLNTRIRLQKALIATNSMSALKDSTTARTDVKPSILAAEEAALKLWSQLDTLRHTLTSQPGKTKRKRDADAEVQPLTPLTTLWHRMQCHESTALSARRSTLDKWSTKLRPVSVLSSSRKLITPLGGGDRHQPLTSVLDTSLDLTNMSRLIARTRTPRSCAPLQAQTQSGVEVPDIFDDADFYTTLLKELVDQRMADTVTSVVGLSSAATTANSLVPTAARRESRIKKKVDTKASKGRKMKFTVHEKLMDFMAAEDRGTWGARQRDELFGGLVGGFGGWGVLREEEGEGEGEEEVEEGLRLFRN